MNEGIKKILYLLLGIILLIAISYGAYVLYNIVMTDATKRIKSSISGGVSEGISSGVGKSMNPLGLIGGVLGGKR